MLRFVLTLLLVAPSLAVSQSTVDGQQNNVCSGAVMTLVPTYSAAVCYLTQNITSVVLPNGLGAARTFHLAVVQPSTGVQYTISGWPSSVTGTGQLTYSSTNNYVRLTWMPATAAWIASSAMSVVGPQGQTGPQGAAGPQGPAGPQGAAGQQGLTGAQGLAGPKGDTGSTGTAGAVGQSGSQGVIGLTGATGAAGAAGAAGTAGAQGPAGIAGTNGGIGPAGPAGPTGGQGSQGSTGPSGSVGPAGAPGSTYVGTCTVSQTAALNLSVGFRPVSSACTGVAAGGSYIVVQQSASTGGYGINSGAYGTAANTLSVTVSAPVISTAYSFTISVWKLN